jgi:hypothetical protein
MRAEQWIMRQRSIWDKRLDRLGAYLEAEDARTKDKT